MKRFIPYILMLIMSLVVVIAIVPSIVRKYNIFTESEGSDTNELVITMLNDPDPKSYGNEMRIASIVVDGEPMDLGMLSNESWVWHPEWGYMLYQHGDGNLTISIDKKIGSLSLEYIKQEGSGKCTISFNGAVEKNIDMYSSKWRSGNYTIRYLNNADYMHFMGTAVIAIFMIMFLIYRAFLYGTGKMQVVPLKICIGSFDFAKGAGILGVILGHSFQLVVRDWDTFTFDIIVAAIAIVLIYSIIPMFFMISGYGSRARDTKTIIKKQLKLLFFFYGVFFPFILIIDLFKVIFVPEFSFGDYFRQIVSIMLMMVHSKTIFGYDFGTVGPLWFVTSLCIARVFLNELLKIKNTKLQILAVVLMLIPFYYSSRFDVAVFCTSTTFVALLYMYVGYALGKYKLFSSANRALRIVLIMGIFVFFASAIANGISFSIAGNGWGENIFAGLIISIIGGVNLVWICLMMGGYSGRITHFIKDVGRKSPFYLLAHSIEAMTIPWESVFGSLHGNIVITGMVITACRLAVIILLVNAILLAFRFLRKKDLRITI